MSGSDAIVINTRERAASGDINDLQSLKDRTLLDTWIEQFSLRTFLSGATPTEVSQPIVFGGLEVGASGVDIAVQGGILLQDSATLSPVPGALDSSYRWGGNRVSTIISNPAPGTDLWYLVEAQMSEVVAASSVKDIFDPGTGLFVPTLVDKRTERQLVFQLVAGTLTNLPLPTGGDWVVIAGVKVPTGGGAIPAANFLDMRPLTNDLGPAVRPAVGSGLRSSSIDAMGDRDAIKALVISSEAWVQGRRLWFDTDAAGLAISTEFVTFREVGTTPGAVSTLSYLYLCPLQNAGTRAIFVRNAYANVPLTNLNGNAILVWSTNAPDADRNLNSTALALPAPFNTYTAPIGSSVCVGAFHTDAAGVIVPTGSVGSNFQAVQSNVATPTAWEDNVTPTGGNTGDAIALTVPVCARDIEILVEWTRDAAGTAAINVGVQPVGGTAANRWWNVPCEGNVGGSQRFVIPARSAFEIVFFGAVAPSAARVTLIGWSL